MSDALSLEALRPRAFAIAYRMLGRVGDAEDVVQEALLRVHAAVAAGEEIRSPEAYTRTVVTRLAIDALRADRARRETYVGEWLPEPLPTPDAAAGSADPLARAELADSLSMAFLLLLERLSPEQRATLLLRDVFDYPYEEIARILDKSGPAVRQLAVRARRHVRDNRPRFPVRDADADRLADRFFAALQDGDLAGLEATLAADVALHGDGGGKAPAIKEPMLGREQVAYALGKWAAAALRKGARVRRGVFNAHPGAVALDASGRVANVMVVEVVEGRIAAVRSVLNPEKLGHLARVFSPLDRQLPPRSEAIE